MIDTAQAMAAPSIPKRGIRTRFKPTFRASATAVFKRFQELFPPMSSTTVTLPVPRFTSIAIDRIARAVAPSSNPGPKTPSSAGPKTASDRNSGHDTTINHQVAVW